MCRHLTWSHRHGNALHSCVLQTKLPFSKGSGFSGCKGPLMVLDTRCKMLTCGRAAISLTWQVSEVELAGGQGWQDVPCCRVSRDACHRHSSAHCGRYLTRLPGQKQCQKWLQWPAGMHIDSVHAGIDIPASHGRWHQLNKHRSQLIAGSMRGRCNQQLWQPPAPEFSTMNAAHRALPRRAARQHKADDWVAAGCSNRLQELQRWRHDPGGRQARMHVCQEA